MNPAGWKLKQGFAWLCLVTISAGCTLVQFLPAVQATPAGELYEAGTGAPVEPLRLAEITFRVTIPADTPSDGEIQLSLLDEVTGLALNPRQFTMQAESPGTYAVTVRLPADTIVKYRYTRAAQIQAAEHTSDGRPVRYRLLLVNGSGTIHDIVSRWNDTAFGAPSGRIMGQVNEGGSGAPVPNLLIAVGGQLTLTRWDGSYLVEGLPEGTHNLVAYALDGTYTSFQQGALVLDQATTPASFTVGRMPLHTVTFHVTVPEGTIPAVPLRLAGNLHQLGNTFADLAGGISTPAARLPVLTFHQDGVYVLALQLPESAILQYKYTLGDGFWNAELTEAGAFRLREFTVPAQDTVINDVIASWNFQPGRAPVWFSATPPSATGAEDVWIQFNPWGWTQPLPMWQTADRNWVLLLNAPLQMLAGVEYRFCRSSDCSSGLELPVDEARSFIPGDVFQSLESHLIGWKDFNGAPETLPLAILPTPRTDAFKAGVEFLPDYHPAWPARFPQTAGEIAELGANWVVLTPSWTYTRQNPPVLEVVPGSDIPWLDLAAAVGTVRAAGLQAALFPTPDFSIETAQWWQSGGRDFAWWSNWFERYESFLLHHAALAEKTGSDTLILGGPWLGPALPGGVLNDGFDSGVPEDSEARWEQIITSVRELFSGQLAWALTYAELLDGPPPFVDGLDSIYLLWDLPLAEHPLDHPNLLSERAADELDALLPIYLLNPKPIVLAVKYASLDGTAAGCEIVPVEGCPENRLIDLEEQRQLYEALLKAVDSRPWIVGFVSRGYYPVIGIQDESPSVHGKPAEITIGGWFHAWLDS